MIFRIFFGKCPFYSEIFLKAFKNSIHIEYLKELEDLLSLFQQLTKEDPNETYIIWASIQKYISNSYQSVYNFLSLFEQFISNSCFRIYICQGRSIL